MEELNPERNPEAYIPRPRWQVWGARIGLILVITAVALYYWSVANPF